MEWMCAECGAPHPKDDPPCENCGAMRFERTVVRQRPDDESDRVSIEWKCTECGRTTPKNNPPCSRCGSMQLESVEANQFDDSELDVGYGARDVAKIVGVLALVGVLAFAAVNAGVLDQSPPTVEDVPGDANASSGLDLNVVETQFFAAVNEERASEDRDQLGLGSETGAMAEYYNQLMVKRGEYPLNESEDVFDEFDPCSTPYLVFERFQSENATIDSYASEDELAQALASSWLDDPATAALLHDESLSRIGVDVHVDDDGTVVSTVILC